MSLTGGGNTWQDFYFLTPGLSTSGHKSVVFKRCAFFCVIFCENIAKNNSVFECFWFGTHIEVYITFLEL
uniref:Uncharacterized protein n=1 Tax=Anguilla anguilla TaxID=7936 RepID=A0A0E9WXS3_ANGAN